MSFTPLIIDNKPLSSSTGETFDVRNPYTNKIAGLAASCSLADCRAAIESAARAFESWESSTLPKRRDIFLRAADIVSTQAFKEKIVETMIQETAAMPYWALFNWTNAVNMLRTHASLVYDLKGETFPSTTVSGATVLTQRRAKGVILAMAPWNGPFALAIRAVTAAIICGNVVVFKASEMSPRSQSLVVDLFVEAGLPPGVLNFVPISRENTPHLVAEMIAHPLVRLVNFTGSDTVGRLIAIEAAKHLKPCVLELGGKAPAIVLADADIGEAAQAIVYGAMAHSGQVCMSTERVIVQRQIAQALVQKVCALTEGLKAGDPMADSNIRLSALMSEAQAENILTMLKEASVAGAEVILGDMTRRGTVIQPHIVTGVFPVLAFAQFDTVEEAITLANKSEYSLTASVWTADIYLGQEVASRLHSGYTNINGPTVHSEPVISIIGLGGASGYGRFDIESFTDKRVVVTHPLGRQYPLFS
ncbi:hypothetical protein AX16_002495 [Volvariella volvacea WC 439]|nr:hypothetical protein AX16_002495 [Volvariella volvacea WC 439]